MVNLCCFGGFPSAKRPKNPRPWCLQPNWDVRATEVEVPCEFIGPWKCKIIIHTHIYIYMYIYILYIFIIPISQYILMIPISQRLGASEVNLRPYKIRKKYGISGRKTNQGTILASICIFTVRVYGPDKTWDLKRF